MFLITQFGYRTCQGFYLNVPLVYILLLSDRVGKATYSNNPPPFLSGMKNGLTLLLKHTALCGDHMVQAVAW